MYRGVDTRGNVMSYSLWSLLHNVSEYVCNMLEYVGRVWRCSEVCGVWHMRLYSDKMNRRLLQKMDFVIGLRRAEEMCLDQSIVMKKKADREFVEPIEAQREAREMC